MNYLGKRVIHQLHGAGTITVADSKNITVKYDSDGENSYSFPSCFRIFLKLLDSDAAADAEALLKEIDDNELKKSKEREESQIQAARRRVGEGRKHEVETMSATVKPFCSADAFFDAYKDALINEISYLRVNGGKRQRLYDGKRVGIRNGCCIYTFISEDDLNYPDGTQITIRSPQNDLCGTIEDCGEYTVTVSTSKNLGQDIPSLEFTAEPWRLTQCLIDRLEEIRENPSGIVKELICNGNTNIDYYDGHIITGQGNAVNMSVRQPITFIWGPPGTGKTQTLAKIASEHIKRGNRVLMLSYSNVSVDGAIWRLYELSGDKRPGVIIRYGYPQLKKLKDHKYLTSFNYVLQSRPELMDERRSLIEERKGLPRISPGYVDIGKRLTTIRNTLSEEEKAAVSKARFVATTVSKALVDKTIRKSKFDVVIVDEASMAYIPQIIFSAGLASKNFICMGDFRQLPPIVQSGPESILNNDIFEYCGIAHAVNSGRNHRWLCLLDTQYRMHPAISDFVSSTMYGNLLKSAPTMKESRLDIVNAEPIEKSPMSFVDLSGAMSVCSKTGDNSRFNPLSAFYTFAYALQAAKSYEVGIITPYVAQSRLIRAMAKDAEASSMILKPISCATVHQFQGSEKDVIIFDAVDCFRMTYPGTLLTSTYKDKANRLFNVALTRSKGKFIGVANLSYLEDKKLAKDLMLKKLIQRAKDNDSIRSASDITDYPQNSSLMRFFSAEQAKLPLENDLTAAKRGILIDIPNAPKNHPFTKRIAELLGSAKAKGIRIIVRAEEIQSLPLYLKPFAVENKSVTDPIVLIDKKISWFGVPFSNANFISEGATIQTEFRPIIRFDGSYTAHSLFGFLEMHRTSDYSDNAEKDSNGNMITDNFSNYILSTEKCPDCRKPMRLQKCRSGKFFLSCSGYPSCKKAGNIDVDFVEQYLYRHGETGQRCPKCYYSLKAKSGKYGVYIQCCGPEKHKYQLDEL